MTGLCGSVEHNNSCTADSPCNTSENHRKKLKISIVIHFFRFSSVSVILNGGTVQVGHDLLCSLALGFRYDTTY